MQGLGAAFVALPATGTLQPFGQEMIEITAYSDMWGSYTDELKIKVSVCLLFIYFFYIAINISGSCRGCDHMVVGFTTTYTISAYHH